MKITEAHLGLFEPVVYKDVWTRVNATVRSVELALKRSPIPIHFADSSDHGLEHWRRVAVWGSALHALMWYDGKNYEGTYGFEELADILENVVLCAYFHDAGRITDDRDIAHGARSAAMMPTILREAGLQFANEFDPNGPGCMVDVLSAVALHCLPDHEIPECYWDNDYTLEVLKQADTLDAMRVCLPGGFDDVHLRGPRRVVTAEHVMAILPVVKQLFERRDAAFVAMGSGEDLSGKLLRFVHEGIKLSKA